MYTQEKMLKAGEQVLSFSPMCEIFYANAYDTIVAMSKWKKVAIGAGIALLFSGAMNIYTYKKAQEGKKQYEHLHQSFQQKNMQMM